jgi:hypothetical protein
MDFRAMRKQLDDMLSNCENACENMRTKHDLAMSQVLNEKQRIQDDLDKMTASVNALTREIDLLKDENKSFMSVSTIVTLTNENANLKKTIAVMEKSISRRNSEQTARGTYLTQLLEKDKVVQQTTPSTVDDAPVAPTPEPLKIAHVQQPEEPIASNTPTNNNNEPEKLEENIVEEDSTNEESEPAVNLYEKKIKGVMYYVDDDDNIYNVLENEEAGEIVGKYVTKSDGKKKITWI